MTPDPLQEQVPFQPFLAPPQLLLACDKLLLAAQQCLGAALHRIKSSVEWAELRYGSYYGDACVLWRFEIYPGKNRTVSSVDRREGRMRKGRKEGRGGHQGGMRKVAAN